MGRWYAASGKPYVVVANKLDKVKKSELADNLARIRETLDLPESVPVLPFSAEKGDGKQDLIGQILSHI